MSDNSQPTNTTPESSNKDVAAKVVSAKRKYFYPAKGINVEADSQEAADKIAKKVEAAPEGELTESQRAINDAALASHDEAREAAAERVKNGQDLPPVNQNDEGDN